MGLLQEVATYLEADASITPRLVQPPGAGYNLVAEDLPTDPDAMVALYEYPGEPPEYVIGNPEPVSVKPHMEVHIRAATFAAARDWARLIHASLSEVVNTTLSGTYYLNIEPLEDPTIMERDERRRWTLAFRCKVDKTPS